MNHASFRCETLSQVVWGWRRSTWDEKSSRLVYFAAACDYFDDSAQLSDSRLVIIRRGEELKAVREQARRISGSRLEVSNDGFSVMVGAVTTEDQQRIDKLDRTRRHPVLDFSHVHETIEWPSRLEKIGRLRPRLVVLAGSGLSYEAGVPTLSTLHQLFGVDGGPGTDFCLEDHDPLVTSLSVDTYSGFEERVKDFHSACARARPSQPHEDLRAAYLKEHISMILTDNIDDIFEKHLGLVTFPTRGDGLTSERYSQLDSVLELVESSPHALLVVGVSADRRGIIKALSRSIPTVIVNPALPVSPYSKNLDYLGPLGFDESGESRIGHVFIKKRARDCLGQVLSYLCGED